MSLDARALKKAEEFVDDGIVKYEDDDEVADDLELSDISILKPLPIYALANRIKKFTLKQGFVAGYVCRKDEEKNTANNNLPKVLIKKLKKATTKISALKTVIRMSSKVLSKFTDSEFQLVIDKVLSKEIEETKLSNDILIDVFSVGDLKKVILLKKIKTIIGSRNEQEKTNSVAI